MEILDGIEMIERIPLNFLEISRIGGYSSKLRES